MIKWTRHEQVILRALKSPALIQGYLDSIPYNSVDLFVRSPRLVMRDRRAQCFDGAIFAAAALQRLGYPPLLCDLRAKKGDDDDHVIALYRSHGAWGSVSKSNFSGLRFREPVYRSLRELVMSYFEHYFNLAGRKTMRAYSVPFDLRRFETAQWQTTDQDLSFLIPPFDTSRHYPVISPAMERGLTPLDARSLKAGMVGLDRKGAFKILGG